MSTRTPQLAKRRPAVIAAAAAAAALLAGASPAAAQAAGARAVSGGTWGTAQEVPGIAALNQHGDAQITSLSCASAGNCSAGGVYDGTPTSGQVFVVSQVNGTWHAAIKVPGTAALNQGGNAEITSVSCGSVGNCSVGGDYRDSSGNFQVFVASQAHGTWHTAIEVPGTAALNQGGNAGIGSVTCATAGNCSAGGNYKDSSGLIQAFVVSQT